LSGFLLRRSVGLIVFHGGALGKQVLGVSAFGDATQAFRDRGELGLVFPGQAEAHWGACLR
jgi:hypothetical protein